MSSLKRFLKPSRLIWLVSLLCMQCVLDNRQAGTSTSVTNPGVSATVSGIAILSDGKIAAGAEISLRLPIVQVSHSGIPTSKLVAFTVADDSGKFTLPMVYKKDVYMEIREVGKNLGLVRDSQQVILRRWPYGLPADGKMGSFRLESPGSITGKFDSPDTTSNAFRWVGVRGTDNFVPSPTTGAFTLTGVSAGHRELVEVIVPDTLLLLSDPLRKLSGRDSVAKADVTPRTVTDIGVIFYIVD